MTDINEILTKFGNMRIKDLTGESYRILSMDHDDDMFIRDCLSWDTLTTFVEWIDKNYGDTVI